MIPSNTGGENSNIFEGGLLSLLKIVWKFPKKDIDFTIWCILEWRHYLG
jgi:hypothetical protein